jgi:nitrous oxidase accessory protein NosD
MHGAVRRAARYATIVAVALFGTALAAPVAGAAATSHGQVLQPSTHMNLLFVSKRGHDSSVCGRAFNPCATIGRAVANASAGAKIIVLPGTYAEMVTVDKPLHLVGTHVTIDASGKNNGILLQGPLASGSSVNHFRVVNAIGEGILATQVTHVRIWWNRLAHNDQGVTTPNAYPECQTVGEVPGDCGEGLHLQATTDSSVVANDVSLNAGGILVSDDIAPTHGNFIGFNRVSDNKPDCGITVPSHNPTAGVFDNTISFNAVTGNGEGGVLLAAGVPGGAAHDNVVTHNFLQGNGFAGVTLHVHFPGSNLNNNVIDENIIATNNVGGDDDAGVTQTTGVLLFSGTPTVTITGTSVRHNLIMNNHFGIWLSHGLVSDAGIRNNTFINVAIPVRQ